jgi:GNAT superfamily N-acetyltransferase
MIRSACEKDVEAVAALVEAAYSVYVPRLGRKPLPMLDDYAALISQEIVYVLEEGGAILGLLILVPEDGAMLLRNIAVRPDAQGRGFGRELLSFAEAKAMEDGYGAIRLYTNELMVENLALYTHCGYTETHRATEHGVHRVYMAKQVTRAG